MEKAGLPDWARVDTRRMRQAYERIDAAWQRAIQGYQETEGRSALCTSGCADCCRADTDQCAWKGSVHLSFSPSQAAILLESIMPLPGSAKGGIVKRAREQMIDPVSLLGKPISTYRVCPLLNSSSGCCVVYPARPIICRTFGLPILYQDKYVPGTISLGCPKNSLGAFTSARIGRVLYDPQNPKTPYWAIRWAREVAHLYNVETYDNRGGKFLDLEDVLLVIREKDLL